VVGGPGSGKTTLAARLGRRLGVVAHDLDDVALSEGADADFRPIRGIASRRSDVLQLSEAATWVTEGTYLWWTEPLFRRADKIIWLDVSWGIAARQIVTRHASWYLRDIRATGELSTRLSAIRHPHIKHLVAFLRWSAHYYALPEYASVHSTNPDDMRALTRAATRTFLEPYASKVTRLSGSELGTAVEGLAESERTIRDGAQVRADTAGRGIAG
jgi:adenylate kinase family enzyme